MKKINKTFGAITLVLLSIFGGTNSVITTPAQTSSTKSDENLSPASITGIVIGSIAGSTLLASGIYYFTTRNKRDDKNKK